MWICDGRRKRIGTIKGTNPIEGREEIIALEGLEEILNWPAGKSFQGGGSEAQ